MIRLAVRISSLALAGFVAILLLTSCGSDERASGTGMMGGDRSYHYSTLTCFAPSSLPGSTVVVSLADMGMTQMMRGAAPIGAYMILHASPSRVPAGQVSIVAQNLGWRTHEVVVLPLANDASEGQRVPDVRGKVSEAGSRGEASASCTAGSGGGINPGAVGWTTLNLSPGRYELVCNLENHYVNGMHYELVVS